ncbi:hypothetical protein JCM10908_005032 [Rhodotorula pacifica]|uniref:uncharacterized protein n=1 Tax=Rhodotorula pacifica TaxID=1495444 RepID=UPI00317FF5AD
MGFLSKLRRRRPKHGDANSPQPATATTSSGPAPLQLPGTAHASEATTPTDEDGHTSNDSGYASAESTSPTVETLALPSEEGAEEEKFAQLVEINEALHRKRRESIRFELFGSSDTDDDDHDEEEDEEEAGEQNGDALRTRPRLQICTSGPSRRPPIPLASPTSPHSAQVQSPRTHPTRASRRPPEAMPGFASGSSHTNGTVLAPASTHAPVVLREARLCSPKDPLRVRLARSVVLVKLRNGLTSAEAGELRFAAEFHGQAEFTLSPLTSRPPSYSPSASGPVSTGLPPSATSPHPLELVLPRLPVWAHRKPFGERCFVTTAHRHSFQDDVPHPNRRGVRPGSATVSSRVATIVAALAEHERLQARTATPFASADSCSLRPARGQPPTHIPPQLALAGNASVQPPPMLRHRSSTSFANDSADNLYPRDLATESAAMRCEERRLKHVIEDDDDERPLATLRRSASTSCINPKQQLDSDLGVGANHVPMPFWLPPLASTTTRRAPTVAWRPLTTTHGPTPKARRGAIVELPPLSVDTGTNGYSSEKSTPHRELSSSPLPQLGPTFVVCTPAKAHRIAAHPQLGSLHWAPMSVAAAAPKSTSFPPDRGRQMMPIATRRPDLRSRHSSVELHGSFKVIDQDLCRSASTKRWSLRKARSFWHASTPNSQQQACFA